MWNKRARLSLCIVLALELARAPHLGWGFPWNQDMAEQPAVQPYAQPMRLPATGTLAEGGEWPVSRFQRALLPINPLAGEAKATECGRKLYEIYCTPCHGITGRGDGPLSSKVGLPPDLTGRIARRRNDGYLYAVIREGTSSMPPHGALLSRNERWEIVNYIRELQQQESGR